MNKTSIILTWIAIVVFCLTCDFALFQLGKNGIEIIPHLWPVTR
jgi:hypothetical protein